IDQDLVISLVQHDAEIQGRYGHDMEFDFDFDVAKGVSTTEKDVSTVEPVSTIGVVVTTDSIAVSTASPTRNTRVSTADDITMVETLVYIRKSAAKDKGKGKMAESETVQTKTKLQQEHERLDFEAAVRLQAELEEEERLQEEEREKYTEAEQARMLTELINQRKRRVNTFVPIESEVDRAVLELATGSSKRDAKEELDQEIPEQGMNVEALQTKYLIIDWEIYTEGTRKYWKIIKVGNHPRSSIQQNQQRTNELKRLFKPNIDDELWKLQNHIHDLTWRLYDSCGVHHVSTKKGIDIYMLIEKEYPLSRGTLTQMLVAKLLMEQDNEMSRELLRKIFMQVERLRR
ncbi:hypothetical protein Tco_0933607, partial [Tanacetum coccineum]